MSNAINPYSASRPDLQQRSVQSGDMEEESPFSESTKVDLRKQRTSQEAQPSVVEQDRTPTAPDQNTRPAPAEEAAASRFGTSLESAIEKNESIDATPGRNAGSPANLEGLSADELKMIHRYFPEVPNLELKLYKSDLSTDKVDPGSVGSRVDFRG